MKKSELFARYDLFRQDVIEIPAAEFNAVLETVPEVAYQDCTTDVQLIKVATDGMDYYCYSSHYKVGWQGEYDGDSFYCKVETVSKARMQEIMDILKQPLQTLFTK